MISKFIYRLSTSVFITIQRNWQHRVHKTKQNTTQSRETDNIGYTRQNKTQHNGLCCVLFCLVYPMLPVSLDCVVFCFVLCILCCQFLWIVLCFVLSCVPYVARNWQHRIHKTKQNTTQSRKTGNIGYTRQNKTQHNPEKLAT
jgi:ABC-type transport system involved in Fe-S cluster assembly fused permease/ATPase subunit